MALSHPRRQLTRTITNRGFYKKGHLGACAGRYMKWLTAAGRVKPEIVALGRPEVKPAKRTGIHVDAETWNDLLDDPEVAAAPPITTAPASVKSC